MIWKCKCVYDLKVWVTKSWHDKVRFFVLFKYLKVLTCDLKVWIKVYVNGHWSYEECTLKCSYCLTILQVIYTNCSWSY